MALNYGELNRIKESISSDLEELTALLSEFNTLVDENVNNREVWYGTSSELFNKKWNDFADAKFPQYKNIFNKEVQNVVSAMTNWGKAEGN